MTTGPVTTGSVTGSNQASQPLAGLHVLVTRPEAQALPWAGQLQALGATVSRQPMMLIEPLADAQAERDIINRVLSFDEYQKAIFISQNAVQYGIPWLDRYWPQLPLGIDWYAIGKATAYALEHHSDVDLAVATDAIQGAMNSESLLQHPSLQALDGVKVLIFRGQGGRDHLAEQLQSRGATVDYCELYRRVSPPTGQALAEDFRQTSLCPVVTVHSGETLTNLCSILPEDDLLWLQQQQIVVPGTRVAAIARDAGFVQVQIAENAGHESMVQTLHGINQHS